MKAVRRCLDWEGSAHARHTEAQQLIKGVVLPRADAKRDGDEVTLIGGLPARWRHRADINSPTQPPMRKPKQLRPLNDLRRSLTPLDVALELAKVEIEEFGVPRLTRTNGGQP